VDIEKIVGAQENALGGRPVKPRSWYTQRTGHTIYERICIYTGRAHSKPAI